MGHVDLIKPFQGTKSSRKWLTEEAQELPLTAETDTQIPQNKEVASSQPAPSEMSVQIRSRRERAVSRDDK